MQLVTPNALANLQEQDPKAIFKGIHWQENASYPTFGSEGYKSKKELEVQKDDQGDESESI